MNSISERKPIPIMLATILFGIWGILMLLGILAEVFFPMQGWEIPTLGRVVSMIIGVLVAFAIAYGLWNLRKWAGGAGIIIGLTGIVFGVNEGSIVTAVIGITMIVLIGIRLKNLR